jgi:uncharacterized protein YbaR (Trm112 family)
MKLLGCPICDIKDKKSLIIFNATTNAAICKNCKTWWPLTSFISVYLGTTKLS